MEDLNLSDFEKEVLRRSENLEVTRRRRGWAIILGSILPASFIWGALLRLPWWVFFLAGLIHAVGVVYERVAVANGFLGYKSVIQKLRARVEELEAKVSS